MKVPVIKSHVPTLAVLAACLGGCASTPVPTLLTLPPAVFGPASASGGGASMPVMSVARIDVPEYLLARRVRYRADDSSLAEWPDTFWAERVEIGISREFAAAVRQMLPGWRLCETNCGEQPLQMSLQVTLDRLDYVRSSRQLHAGARLMLWSPERPARLLRTEERRYAIAGHDDTAQSQARTVTELLRRIAMDASAMIPLPAPASPHR
ncbi:PqiC family protein [Candidatus Nitrotoga arctica]|uniref:ABC-type transport auxiliary lipoprotein component n=1 Tax=Candidatus Nitrotoga arctica TaxID=453162 RepID=A0ABN8AMG8_9PROT|nr:ABC-type transport auxiliary lipoprotein family protein [Candidatus Nitrotoga arctica]CAG9931863.1 ABC-type transport auxiliary lipoprotein component [Candidatus Nitrotoga arctica]